jgi:WYL_2, Sm-like SH3 beta-barrel fold
MKTKYVRQELVDLLRETAVTINFTKTDGTKRDMKCTLVWDFIPVEHRPQPKKDNDDMPPRKENLDTIRVFDLEKIGWRSFRLDSINSVEV